MITESVSPRIERVESREDEFYGRFVVEPLERGFGHTLGNALRRSLLSSLPGAAVTSVQIEGVQHEFSTIPGVKEDVTEMILNLKELSVRLLADVTKQVEIIAEMALSCGYPRGQQVEVIDPPPHPLSGAPLHDLTMEHGFGYIS